MTSSLDHVMSYDLPSPDHVSYDLISRSCDSHMTHPLQVQLGGIINTTKGQVDEAREQYEHMQTEDREMDRYFKRDFADCEQYTDQLYKLFRKRPR